MIGSVSEISVAFLEATKHADRQAKVAGGMTVEEIRAMATFCAGAYEFACNTEQKFTSGSETALRKLFGVDTGESITDHVQTAHHRQHHRRERRAWNAVLRLAAEYRAWLGFSSGCVLTSERDARESLAFLDEVGEP